MPAIEFEYENGTAIYSDELPMETIIHYAQSNADFASSLTNLLAFLVAVSALLAIFQSLLLLYGFATRNRQSLSADYAYLIIHSANIALAMVGLCYLGPMFEDSLGAVRMTKIHLDKTVLTQKITTGYNCFLPFVFQVCHMLMFYVISLTALANYLNIAFPRYSMSTKSMLVICSAITIFCVLVNLHFLLAHCVSQSTETLFDVDDSSVVVKYIIVDGMAFMLTLLLCGHSFSLISATQNAPDAKIWKRECMASVTVAMLFSGNTVLTFIINVAAYNSVPLTLHANHVTLATTMVTLSLIPLSLSMIRPATGADFDHFFDRVRHRLFAGEDDLPNCCARCLSHKSPQQADMELYWHYPESNDSAQLVMTNSTPSK